MQLPSSDLASCCTEAAAAEVVEKDSVHVQHGTEPASRLVPPDQGHSRRGRETNTRIHVAMTP